MTCETVINPVVLCEDEDLSEGTLCSIIDEETPTENCLISDEVIEAAPECCPETIVDGSTDEIIYTGTYSLTKSCPVGVTSGDGPTLVTAAGYSNISQANADAEAYANALPAFDVLDLHCEWTGVATLTKNYTCPNGYSGSVSVTETATSFISQSDADSRSLAAATAALALIVPTCPEVLEVFIDLAVIFPTINTPFCPTFFIERVYTIPATAHRYDVFLFSNMTADDLITINGVSVHNVGLNSVCGIPRHVFAGSYSIGTLLSSSPTPGIITIKNLDTLGIQTGASGVLRVVYYL